MGNISIGEFKPPKWLKLTPDAYKRALNREALALTKRDRKRGGTYAVKEALRAVHCAFHNCDGTDPYDGMPLDEDQLRRIPMVAHRNQEPIAEYEILSRQTYLAKSDMTADEYLNHCKAVVAFRETQKEKG